jgi:hypothetical protein
MGIPVALESVLQTMSEKCMLTSWDIRSRGGSCTLTVRFHDTTAAIDTQQEPATSVTRFRKKSPSELRRDANRSAKANQKHVSSKVPSDSSVQAKPTDIVNFGASHVVTESEVHVHPCEDIALFESPSRLTTEHNNNNIDTLCQGACSSDSCTTVKPDTKDDLIPEVQESLSAEEIIIFNSWHNDSVLKSIGDYLATFTPEQRRVVVASADSGAMSDVKKVVHDQRYGRYALYAKTETAIFEYDLRRGEVVKWFPISDPRGAENKVTLTNVERWYAVTRRFPEEIATMRLHIAACCSAITRLDPVTCDVIGDTDSDCTDQTTFQYDTRLHCLQTLCIDCGNSSDISAIVIIAFDILNL